MLALLPPDYVVAGLGCGTGPILAAIAPIRARLSEWIRRRRCSRPRGNAPAGMENVELLRGDLAALPIQSESVDAAMMVLALTYVPDACPCLLEMVRILKPGGRAVIVDLLPHDREDFRRQMGQQCLGFDPRRSSPCLSRPDSRPCQPDRLARGQCQRAGVVSGDSDGRINKKKTLCSQCALCKYNLTIKGDRNMAKKLEFKVADLSLAEWGRKEIMLAEQEMPGLMAVRAEYAKTAAAQGPADHRLAAHDHPDGRADRDAGGPGRGGALVLVQHLLAPRTTPPPPSPSGPRARPRIPRASRSSPGRARRWKNTGGAREKALDFGDWTRARRRSSMTAATPRC